MIYNNYGDTMFGILYLQSEYSMLKNIIPLETLALEVKKSGYDFLALSDDNNLHALVSFHKLCKKHNLKPVTGMKVDCFLGIDKTSFLVFSKTKEGYENLLQLSTLLKTRKEMVTFEEILKYQEGLIFVSAGIDSVIDQALIMGDVDKAISVTKKIKESLSLFYIGLSLQSFDFEMKHATTLVQIANDLNVLLLPINKTSYLIESDREILDLLIKIENDQNRLNEDYDFSFLTKDQLIRRFQDYSFVFDNLKKVIEGISFDYPQYDFKMPVYPSPNGASSKEYLEALAAVGLKKRVAKTKRNFQEYDKRLRYELKVINDMGFDDYFLIVYDFVNYAKRNGIIVGPGRGSAAGSLVSYALGITEIDPISYNLLFERFLNPERRSMPDIDLDFPDDKRDQVITYVKDKYQSDHICSISTFSTFGYKQALRDIARVLKVDGQRLKGILSRVEKQSVDKTDDLAIKLINSAKRIEGLPRHIGTHAAGIILSDANLTKSIPLQNGAYNFYQSQLEAKDLEEIGLLKIDFLGIRNLAIIDEVLKHTDIKNLRDLPLNDKKVFKMLKEGDTTGIFQLESSGMRNVLRKMNPSDFEDIVAVIALYRPGPMDNIDEYIKRKNGKPFTYLHPGLEPILKNTFGILVYQEQIMQIAVSFADYSYADADLLRRAVSKKDKSILDKERDNFVSKCLKKGHDIKIADEIYDYILKFANYGFNRSHSVAYALVAYQMAYLKINYYPIFMATLMSSVIGNEGLTIDYINEIRRKQIRIIAPNINISTDRYLVEGNQMYYPLLGIKGIGQEIVKKILLEREKGLFKSYQDFKKRTASIVNKKALEQLIYSGALDSFNYNQKTLIMHSEITDVEYSKYIDDAIFMEYEDFSLVEKLEHEQKAFGFNIKYNPINIFQKEINDFHLTTIDKIKNSNERVIGIIKKVKEIKTKSQEKMAFITFTDSINEIEVVAFPNIYKELNKDILSGIVVITLKIEQKNENRSYIALKMARIEDIT